MRVISTGTITDYNHWERLNSFLAGLMVNVVGVTLLIVVGSRLGRDISIDPVASRQHVILVAPITYQPPVASPPVVPQVARLETPELPPAATPPKIEAPKLQPKLQPKPEVPKPEIPNVAAAPRVVSPLPTPPVERKPTPFDAAKSEVATVQLPARQVQTGGFGDPSGIPGKGDPKRNTATVASVGSFELPSGGGKGNGTGGSHGVSGTIRAAGFGDGVPASLSPHAGGIGNAVVAGGFGERVAQGGGSPRAAEKKPELQPVEIVFKPRPAYTPEALRQKVEGEVLIDVVFTASGSLQINRVVKGLGYGLDDQALAVAQHIRFKPALRDGQPYDCAALVHIVFELAK